MSLHGSYGIAWVIKDFVAPDASFLVPLPILDLVLAYVMVLLPYNVIGYMMVAGYAEQNTHPERIFVSAWMFIFGILLMLTSDIQKYFVLKERKHLIDYGFNKYTRNPNYLGEALLYASFANMVNMWQAWAMLIFPWLGVFLPSMLKKDESLAKKAGWQEYK